MKEGKNWPYEAEHQVYRVRYDNNLVSLSQRTSEISIRGFSRRFRWKESTTCIQRKPKLWGHKSGHVVISLTSPEWQPRSSSILVLRLPAGVEGTTRPPCWFVDTGKQGSGAAERRVELGPAHTGNPSNSSAKSKIVSSIYDGPKRPLHPAFGQFV